MARPLRIHFQNAYYHVMNRGRGRQRIFESPADYQAFLDTLAEADERFGLRIHAYCLMGNHYHLLVQTPRGNLARCMRHVNGLYTQRYNRLHDTDGPLFRGRYKAIVVQADRYLLALTRYIHRNPLGGDLGRKPLASFPWSSYPAYIAQAPSPPWLVRTFTYELLGHRRKYQEYQHYVEGEAEDLLADFYGETFLKPVLGSEAFVAGLVGKEQKASPRLVKAQGLVPSLATITQAVGTQLNVPVKQLRRAVRGRGPKNEARWLAVCLCRDLGGYPLAEIAAYFGMGHISGVNRCVGKLRQLLASHPRLAQAKKVLRQDLTS
ncbi:MAG: transposase [Nitrospirae bacterium]|nr:transposase [Nitrospirota bacterium]MDA1304550.1 transposase [Nitrospirota bacterium]